MAPATIPEETVSNAAPAMPIKVFIVVLVLMVVGRMTYYMLPLHLTKILLAKMTETEKIYLEAHGMGLRSPVDTETLDSLKRKVSGIVQETVRNSDSWHATLYDFVQGRAFILLHCIYEVHCFETRIKTLKELGNLRAEGNFNPGAIPLQQLEGGTDHEHVSYHSVVTALCHGILGL
ncbi:hypothetical protein K438DRAFT_2013115 [Mycena galopus ATCC 62051]|nr:hypothetical protein K438DRAFT_2013115 [Mycena galopus ATCC 62051]